MLSPINVLTNHEILKKNELRHNMQEEVYICVKLKAVHKITT